VLHAAAYSFLGLEGSYRAIDVPSGTLQDFIRTQGKDFDYFSLTMPLKEEVLSLELEIDEKTLEIQSGNTLYFRDGTWRLTSTDGSGFVSALSHAGLKSFNKVLILGAGGTARAVTGSLDSIATEIHVMGRTSIRQEALERAIHLSHFEYLRWSPDVDFTQYDLVVNTTPAGAADLLEDSVHQGTTATSSMSSTNLGRPNWLKSGAIVAEGFSMVWSSFSIKGLTNLRLSSIQPSIAMP
jgi:shikimate dehydrogenase